MKIILAVFTLGLFACSEAPTRYSPDGSKVAAVGTGNVGATPGPMAPTLQAPAVAPVAAMPAPAPATVQQPAPAVVVAPTPAPLPAPAPTVDLKAFVKDLDGFRWEFGCNADPGDGQECDSDDAPDKEVEIGGDAKETYLVELQFRGVVEPMMYKDGKLDGDRFYIGGSPNNGTYNIYSIETSEPKGAYFLNSNPNVGHDVFVINYKKTIKMAGGSKVKMYGNGQNKRMIANYKFLSVPGIDAANTIFNGQYIQMNVVSVQLMK